MQDTLFTSDLMALRKRRANVAHQLGLVYVDCATYIAQSERLKAQYKRTFYHLTVVELRLTDKVAP